MFSLLNHFLNLFYFNFYAQVAPGYDAAREHLSTKGIQGKDMLVFVVFGVIALVFIIFLIFVYFKEKDRPRY